MLRLLCMASAIALSLVGVTGQASAANHWSSIGSGCYVSPTYNSNASVDPVTGAVTFAGNSTGTIKLTCPVTAWFLDEAEALDPDTFYATFDDDDGTTQTCRIWVELERDNIGATSSRAAITGIDDTGGGIYTAYANSSNRQMVTDGFTHTWDSSTYHYWVIVEMARPNTGCNVTFYGVGLYDAP